MYNYNNVQEHSTSNTQPLTDYPPEGYTGATLTSSQAHHIVAFFVAMLRVYPDVPTVGIGTASGQFFGASRNASGHLQGDRWRSERAENERERWERGASFTSDDETMR